VRAGRIEGRGDGGGIEGMKGRGRKGKEGDRMGIGWGREDVV
jgi:hypothetical protein